MIQLHRLEGFFRVAQAGGYSRAAREFPYPITQPAVHQQVRKLENDLGVRLFVRVGRDRVEPTAAGKHLLTFCAPFFEQLPAVVRAIESMSFGGELRIDAAGLALRQLLPAWIKRIRKRRDDIDVVLHEVDAPDMSRLLRGDCDLLVDYLSDTPAGIATQAVARCAVFLAVAADHKASSRARLRLADMRGEPFVSYHESLPHHALQMRALNKSRVVPSRVLTAGSVDTILSFVQAGLGFSLIPWIDESGPRQRGVRVERLGGQQTRFAISAAWRDASPNPLVEHALAVAPTCSEI